MIEIGAMVPATINRIEPYGIYLEHGEDSVFVTADNLAWVGDENVLSHFKVGQVVDILIERYHYEKQMYVGSLRRLHPESNPYRVLSRQPPDAVIEGIVKLVHPNGIVVDLCNGCKGDLPLTERTKTLNEGEPIKVQVASLEVDEKQLVLKLFDAASTGQKDK